MSHHPDLRLDPEHNPADYALVGRAILAFHLREAIHHLLGAQRAADRGERFYEELVETLSGILRAHEEHADWDNA